MSTRRSSSPALRLVLAVLSLACTRRVAEKAPPPPSSPETLDANAGADTEEEVEEETEAVLPPAAMGTWIKGETLSMRIDSAALANKMGTALAKPKHHFVRVVATIENRGIRARRIRSTHFRLRADDGREYPVSDAEQIAFAASADELFLAPKLQDRFEVIFLVDDDATPERLIYEDASTRMFGAVQIQPERKPAIKRRRASR